MYTKVKNFNKLYLPNMKKLIVILVSVAFISTSIISCKAGHTRCAAYGKINKIDTGKTFTNKTEKSL